MRPASAPARPVRTSGGFSFRALSAAGSVSGGPPGGLGAGGVSAALVDLAWATLTGGHPSKKSIPAKALLEKLKLFQPSATADDVAFLLGDEPGLTKELLYILMVGNTSLCLVFDPLYEATESGAFGAPGSLTYGALGRMQEGLGGAAITEKQWQTLLQEGDCDKDGQLGLTDLRGLLSKGAKW